MKRIPVEKRPNSTRLVQSQGIVYCKDPVPGDIIKEPFWPDDRYYSFTSKEIELLEEAGKDVFDMCCEAAEYLVERPEIITSKMAIPAFALKQIIESWNREPGWGSVYGRFDICFGGLDHPDPRLRTPKFYEFNADTPTTIIEAGSIQWFWLEQTGHGKDQFNSIYEDLIEAWKRNLALIEEKIGHRVTVYFAVGREPSGEDALSTTFLVDTCQQAGWLTKTMFMDQIALGPDGRFYDQYGEHIDVIFKLYPWEWMVDQEFGKACFKDMDNIGQRNEDGEYIGGTVWIEAPYKMLWSNKTLFAILWDLFKDDPRSKWLLPTYLDGEAPSSLTKFARKPIFSREGSDVVLQDAGEVIDEAKSGNYGKEGFIIQELALPPEFKNERGVSHYPVLGLWFVDGEPAGLGIREGITPITSGLSSYVPHSISDAPLNYERQPVPSIHEIEASLQYVGDESRPNSVLSYIESVVS